MRAKQLILALAGVILTALSLEGCGPFWVNPYIAVEKSALNWMEIHYYNLEAKPIRRYAVYINGMGHVEVRKGTSARISNDFARGLKEETWNNISTQRKTIDADYVNSLFQDLVNRGVLDAEKYFKDKAKDVVKDRFIAVKANINNRTYSENENVFETDPELAESLYDVVQQFRTPD